MLSLIDVHAGYGWASALHGINLDVAPGELLLVIGPNGAGKSTLVRAIAGFTKVSRGSIRLNGDGIARMRPETLAKRGVRLVLEGHRVFPELSVEENLALGKIAMVNRSTYPDRRAQIFDMFPILGERRNHQARELSGGQQQFLALGQALIAGPSVLLCDEPSRGVALGLTNQILGTLRELATSGLVVIVVEQVVEAAMPFADRMIVLRQGTVVAEGPPDDFDRDRIRDLFLGV